ncbi:unnamed protein product [Malus baccata var. baccata]
MAEIKTNEEIKKAKESIMQAWIDSRPLIDELELVKCGLACAENRYDKQEHQIQKGETRMINGINQALDQTHQETERFKCDADEELQARSRLKQGLLIRRQTLRTLQLGLEAVRIEKEALVASKEEALKYINSQDENFLSDWRVLVASEQKLATEASRNKALEKLNRLLSEKVSREGEIQEESINYMLPQAQNKEIAKTNQRNPRSRSNNKKLSVKKKPSVVQKIRQYFVRKIKRMFE